MPQIPRQFLQRPQMGSVGRRDRQIAQTKPGVADQVNAVIAASRGLDLTPIGDTLYKTGSAFERMERERVEAEDELKKMKQMSAARSVIINTTQKLHDAYEEIKVQNLSDPEEARRLYHEKVQAVMDEDQVSLDAIGPYAFEPYTRHVTETMTTLQPKLTAQAIGNSRTMLEEQLREQTRQVVHMAGTVEDDDEAGKMMEMQFSAIMDESYGFLSEADRMVFGKAAMNQFVAARFRKKWADNPKGALSYLNQQTGLDPETRHKIYGEVVSESNSFNNYLEGQMKLQDYMQGKLKDDRYQHTFTDLSTAMAEKNPEKVLEILQSINASPTDYDPSKSTQLQVMANEFLSGKDEQSGPSDNLAFFVDALATQSVHVTESWYNSNFSKLSNKERIQARNLLEAKRTKEGEGALTQYKGLVDRVKDRLLALHPDVLNPKNLSKEEQAQFALGNTAPVMERLRKEAAEKFALLDRDAMTLMDAARYTNSRTGANYDNFERRVPAIEDALFRQYENSFKNPKARPESIVLDLGSEVNMWRAGKRSLPDLLQSAINHAKNQKEANGGFYDPEKDPVYQRAQAEITKAKQPAVGAAGARAEQANIAEPEEKPVHTGILPDIEPVGRMEPARTIGKRVTDERFAGLVEMVGIGAQSAAEESSGDPGIVGNEPDGTKSYGMFQINQTNIPEFLRFLKGKGGEHEARVLSKAQPGSTEFKRLWQQVAQGEEFNKRQREFAEQEFYAPVASEFEKHFSVAAGNLPQAIPMALFSTGIQHGGAKKIVKMAAAKIGEPRGASPQEILQAIYEARTEYVMRLTSLDDETKQNLAARYQREYKRGLNYL